MNYLYCRAKLRHLVLYIYFFFLHSHAVLTSRCENNLNLLWYTLGKLSISNIFFQEPSGLIFCLSYTFMSSKKFTFLKYNSSIYISVGDETRKQRAAGDHSQFLFFALFLQLFIGDHRGQAKLCERIYSKQTKIKALKIWLILCRVCLSL